LMLAASLALASLGPWPIAKIQMAQPACWRSQSFRLSAVIFVLTYVASGTSAGLSAIQRSLGTEVQPAGPGAESANSSSTNASSKGGLVNGTITEHYWNEVDAAIAAAALVTAKPHSVNDAPPTPTPEPWSKILDTEESEEVLDTPKAAAEIDNYELATPPPPISSAPKKSNLRKMSVLPYNMALGATVMYEISQKNTPSPLPSQSFVDETFVAQCPMMLFAGNVLITPPRCGSSQGTWQDPNSTRAILRWKTNDKGGVDFGVDSAVTGPGSVHMASLNEKLTLNSNEFELFNCLGVMRYTLEEKVVKVDHMAPQAQSTAVDHDVGQTQSAVFYQYTIKHPNGSSMAQSSLYRLSHEEVNFTAFINGAPTGHVIAAAKREGKWEGDAWRTCGNKPKGWNIEFPHEKGSELITVGTIQDLQVASAAM
ncbi:unnamed protein product, partial [Polarella glacialis]